jgi:glyoxylase-like metal-dependent hydrolase (beta-lactamase superfamily II)
VDPSPADPSPADPSPADPSNKDPRPATADDAWARGARAGIHRLAVPTPFLVGRVNCYLIEDEPLTLVDTGPNSGKSLDELQRALELHGRRIEDLELIVITHQHMDHLGLLEILARRSGADVAALHLLTGYLAGFNERARADDEFAESVMRRHGVPEDLTIVLASVGAAFRAFGSSGHVTRELHDGDVLTLRNRRLRVLHRPGHSPSDTIFWDEERRILIAGDHLLLHISSNPLISRPLAGDGDAASPPHALMSYIDSMRATRELPAELVLTGHGDPIVDHVALIDERVRMHDRRARKMLGLLAGGPLTAFELATAMWGNIAVTQAFLTLSEVVGHMDLLAAQGKVHERQDGELVRFEATAS